jgi:type II secretory pathway pseudopilin PulG
MRRRGRRGSWTLIELLVVAVLLAGLAIWLLPRYLGSGQNNPARNTIQAPIQRAQGVDCQNNLRQVRLAITMAQQTNERFPASLQELSASGITREMLACPVSKQLYVYDPRTGRVGCPYPPHRAF